MFQRVRNRSLVAGMLGSIALSGSIAWAQGNPGQVQLPARNTTAPAQNQSTVPLPRPGGLSEQGTPVQQPVDPEMMKVLQIWEQHTGKIQRMEGDFLRYEYDKVFRVERRHVGKYYYEAPDQGRMDFLTDKKLPDPPQHVVGGVKYEVASGQNESWICNGQDLFSIQIDAKTYHQIKIPPQFQGEAIKDGPLPFLFGMKAEEAVKKYVLQFGDMHMKGADPKVHIIAFPLMPQQQREFSRSEILINPKNFEPIAVKLFDPGGNKETVYTFTKHEPKSIPWLTSKFRVNLATYQKINGDEKIPPRQESNRVDPNGPVLR